jgi:hypothetical protein
VIIPFTTKSRQFDEIVSHPCNVRALWLDLHSKKIPHFPRNVDQEIWLRAPTNQGVTTLIDLARERKLEGSRPVTPPPMVQFVAVNPLPILGLLLARHWKLDIL